MISNKIISAKNLKEIAANIRFSIIDMAVVKASHHIGCALDIVEILTYLYFDYLYVDPNNPNLDDRDIFILSKGHAASALYAVLAEKRFFSKKLLKEYDVDGGILPEHASRVVPGVELSTGSLGHGLSAGIGWAVASRNDGDKRKVVVLMSDGELNEGSNWEAFMFAGHHKLSNLIAIVDKNNMQGYAETNKVINLDPLSVKMKAFGWEVVEIDGHDFNQIKEAFKKISKISDKPKMIIANTIKGKGVALFEGKFESHYKSLTLEEKTKILKELGGEK